MEIIDLSVDVASNPSEPMPIKLKVQPHSGGSKFGRRVMFLGKRSLSAKIRAIVNYISGKERITKKSFPNEEFINEETISLSVHTGTHLDAPYHYGRQSEGRKARTIDEVPLEWCFGNGVVLNFAEAEPGYEINSSDIENALATIDYTIQEKDIVLLRTGTDKKWGTPRYFFEAPGLGKSGVEYLVSRGVKIIGTDCYSLDCPFPIMLNKYYKTRDKTVLWPAHFYGREKEYCHIERLCNLDKIPKSHGFKFCCFPIKLKSLGAAWIRAVAIVEKGGSQ
ncbi:MAG: cyclase family protein [Chitinivibrionales bacterium]|nr:cyclase family protein [Chitinivibrionales bacterium]